MEIREIKLDAQIPLHDEEDARTLWWEDTPLSAAVLLGGSVEFGLHLDGAYRTFRVSADELVRLVRLVRLLDHLRCKP